MKTIFLKSILSLISAFVIMLGFTSNANAIAGDKDCTDFSSKQTVMEFWYNNGYSASNDPHDLDRDNDGLPCEVSKGEYDSYKASKNVGYWKNSYGKWYYYSNGALYKGWLYENGKWYYLDKSGVMKTGWQFVNGSWYYLEFSGVMKTGWFYDGAWYYLKSSGAMATGWAHDGSSWYYLNSNGTMKSGWLLDGNIWYYLQGNGAMKTGWEKISGQWYFFEKSGSMKTGWVLDGGSWYYLNGNGSMKTGWLQQGTNWYFLLSNGVMASNMKVDGYTFGPDGVWIPNPEPTFDQIVTEVTAAYGIEAIQINRAEFSLLIDGVEVGYVIENNMVVLEKAFRECAIELALAMELPPPVSESQLVSLVDEALTYGVAYSDGVAVETDETYLAILWGYSLTE